MFDTVLGRGEFRHEATRTKRCLWYGRIVASNRLLYMNREESDRTSFL